MVNESGPDPGFTRSTSNRSFHISHPVSLTTLWTWSGEYVWHSKPERKGCETVTYRSSSDKFELHRLLLDSLYRMSLDTSSWFLAIRWTKATKLWRTRRERGGTKSDIRDGTGLYNFARFPSNCWSWKWSTKPVPRADQAWWTNWRTQRWRQQSDTKSL